MNLTMLEARYPFDRTGTSRDNYVHGEVHTLPPVNNRIIVPKNGAFFANSLVVSHSGQTLVKGKDYELGGLYQDATVEVGQDVNVMVVITNLDINDEITLNYQVVGGLYTGTFETIQEYVNVLLVDPRKVRWDDIINKPEFFVPKEHFHDINDVYGLNELIPRIDAMILAIQHIRSKEMRGVYTKIMQVKASADALVDDINSKLNTKLQEIQESYGSINTLNNRVNDLINRVLALENSSAIRDMRKALDKKDNELASAIALLNQNKANQTDLDEKYNELINKFNTYFKDGKLKNEYVRISKTRRNPIIMKDDGLAFKYEIPPNVNQTTRYINWYVDNSAGNDETGDGSNTNPYRTVLKVIEQIVPTTTNVIHLREGQTHVISPNDHPPITNGCLRFETWGLTGSYTTVATLQLGSVNKEPYRSTSGLGYSNYCLHLHNGSLVFKNVKIKINQKVNSGMPEYWWSAIGGRGNESTAVNTVTLLGTDTRIDFGSDNRCSLWGGATSGLSKISIDVDALNPNYFTGNGRLVYSLSDNVAFHVITTTNKNYTELFTPNETQKSAIDKLIPQLRVGITKFELINTNIDPNSYSIASGSTLPASLLPINSDSANMLTVKDEKLWVGYIEHDFYVDATNGNDNSGNGTKTNPYRTIAKVFSLNFNRMSEVRVWLKQSQEHIVDIPGGKTYAFTTNVAKLFFGPWLDNHTLFTSKSDYNTNDRTINQLGTKFTLRGSNGQNASGFFSCLEPDHTEVEFNNLNIKINNLSDNVALSINYPTGHAGTYSFYDCWFELPRATSSLVATTVPNTSSKTNVIIRNSSAVLESFITGNGILLRGNGSRMNVAFDPKWLKYINSKSDFVSRYLPGIQLRTKDWGNDLSTNLDAGNDESGTSAAQLTAINTAVDGLRTDITTRLATLENSLNNYVNKTDAQTIGGIKTFTDDVKLSKNDGSGVISVTGGRLSLTNSRTNKSLLLQADGNLTYDNKKVILQPDLDNAINTIKTQIAANSNFVTLDTAQSITGQKTFTNDIKMSPGGSDFGSVHANRNSGIWLRHINRETYLGIDNNGIPRVNGNGYNNARILTEKELGPTSTSSHDNDIITGRILRGESDGSVHISHRLFMSRDGRFASLGVGTDTSRNRNGGFLIYNANGQAVSIYVRNENNTNILDISDKVECVDIRTYSDRRLKDDLVTIPNALAKVNQLTGYTYLMKPTNLRQAGVIAQDVLAVLPEAVGGIESDSLTVDYNAVIGLLVNAVKELTERVNQLEMKEE